MLSFLNTHKCHITNVDVARCNQQSTETVTHSTAKMASWLMLSLQGPGLVETPTLMMMSSGRWEMAKVTGETLFGNTQACCNSSTASVLELWRNLMKMCTNSIV